MTHRLFVKQLARSTRADGTVDLDLLAELVCDAYEESDRDRRRTDRSIALMVEELEDMNRVLERLVEARTAELEFVRGQLQATFEAIDEGILMVGVDGRVRLANPRAMELLLLPDAFFTGDTSLADLIAHEMTIGSFGAAVPSGDLARPTVGTAEFVRRDGVVLEIRSFPMSGGGLVKTIKDITERRAREAALREKEAEYRGLFENAVIGIYRSSIDGRQIRANPALVRLNGYDDEAEMLSAVADIAREWYVDPQRRVDFARELAEKGRVTDFVSEIYRHKTRERIWISEAAWIVRGPNGEPICYEGTVIDATERKMAEEKIAHIALHDALTGLPNRTFFLERLSAAFGDEVGFAVHLIDLDKFKEVNDTLGHGAGDELLVAAAKRLKRVLRADDVVARLGGDEFAVVQRARNTHQAARVAERIVQAMSRPFLLSGQRVTVGASIGVAIAGRDGTDPDTLLKHADVALYRAKAAGRRAYALFEPHMVEAVRERRELEQDLRSALGNGELFLVYQPIVETATRAACSYEALLRWRHPSRGVVSPADFIPIAEETGLIVPIGEWVLRQACRQAAHSGVSVSVNLSPVQFQSPGLVEAVAAVLADTGLPSDRLMLEITESLLLSDDPSTLATLEALRDLGCVVALDDFGTGYSALGYLQRFTFDRIKLDKTFIGGPGEAKVADAIVQGVIDLAARLGIDAVAEGVETEEQLITLTAKGCRLAQGYFFGRPRPAAEVFASVAPADDLADALIAMRAADWNTRRRIEDGLAA